MKFRYSNPGLATMCSYSTCILLYRALSLLAFVSDMGRWKPQCHCVLQTKIRILVYHAGPAY